MHDQNHIKNGIKHCNALKLTGVITNFIT